jgi:hypothetical protein
VVAASVTRSGYRSSAMRSRTAGVQRHAERVGDRSYCLGELRVGTVDQVLPRLAQFRWQDQVVPRVDQQGAVNDRCDVVGCASAKDELVGAATFAALGEVELGEGPLHRRRSPGVNTRKVSSIGSRHNPEGTA